MLPDEDPEDDRKVLSIFGLQITILIAVVVVVIWWLVS